MKNILKLICVTISLFLTIIACQKVDIQEDNKQLIENLILPTKHTSEASFFRKKLEEEKRKGNLRKETPIMDFNKGNFSQKNAKVAAVDKSCGKFKAITSSYPAWSYDETMIVKYRANNLVDYIDVSYSDDSTYNGRISFNYNGNFTELTLTYQWTDGEVSDRVDKLKLNSKGYATEWAHDLTNFYYDDIYVEYITYNSDDYPTEYKGFTVGTSDLVFDEICTYNSAKNLESYIEKVKGDKVTYTYDLTKKELINLRYYHVQGFTNFYGKINANLPTKKVVTDNTGKVVTTQEWEREFNAEGYPTKVTEKWDGVVDIIFKDIVYDCRNYNISQPRSYK